MTYRRTVDWRRHRSDRRGSAQWGAQTKCLGWDCGASRAAWGWSRGTGGGFRLVSYVDFPLLDAEIRIVLVLNGDTVEMSADALGLTMESNGITILEPFDASIKISNASGKTSIQLVASDIFMNFSFSIFRLFLAVEEDILSFLRMTSKKSTVLCSEFDRVGMIKNPVSDQVYAFWRPRAPTGLLSSPPTRGVIAVNTSLIRVKRPKSFTLVWSPSSDDVLWAEGVDGSELTSDKGRSDGGTMCSIWFPEAPKGYVALGCVASPGSAQPPISSVFCVLASLVTPCGLRDCISIGSGSRLSSDYRCPDLAFWRVDNAAGAFLPADPATLSLTQRAYELRHLYFGFSEISPEKLNSSENEASTLAMTLSNRRVYLSFYMVFRYEPPNACIVLQDSEGSDLYKAPSDFQLVGHIKKQRKTDSISFWMPQAPPGFVTLGCVACKGMPKQSDFSSLRCIRADMISTDQFLDESIWDTSDSRFAKEPFSIWAVGNELGTFIVWSGFKKPPKRFALKLIGPDIPSGSDDTVIDTEIRTFSAALFDDYGGLILFPATFNLRDPPLNGVQCRGRDPETLPIWPGSGSPAKPSSMVPLCNVSLSGVGFSLRGGPECLNSSMMFSLAARSYNDKYESWEPLIEPVEGSLRYQSSPTAPGVASQLRITSTRDLNLNMSVSNANMILQAYASWNNLSHVQESCEVICVRPFMTFTNRVGQNMFLKFSSEDEPKILWVSDTRVSFIHHKTDGPTEIQCVAPDKMDKKPCKIMWDVPWEEVMALELAKAGYPSPSHLIVHMKSFRRGESFVQVIKCNTEQVSEEGEPQAVRVCSVVRKMWKAHQTYVKQAPSGQRHVSSLNEVDVTESHKQHRAIITSTTISSSGSVSNEQRLVEHSINFARIWSSDRESKGRCTLCRKQSLDSDEICSIWRPVCPDGYVSIGDIARSGSHPPNVAAIYRKSEKMFAFPVGYDLVWRNCLDDYRSPISIWHPRAPQGYVALGCVAVPSFSEPELDSMYCIAESICEENTFEPQKIWSAPDSYPWACHIYQVHSDALHFVALRQPREESEWKPKRVIDNPQLSGQTSDAQ
ncbi:UNVERIFIED_CONTAM: hypothetical protein Slati_1770400 [Sesamum latifolium]|uniref:Uncharacterized protein n=1 Tax=Sesamum latifolium TaxID=2727402 RepID=A0AAW2WXM9_9LAMI